VFAAPRKKRSRSGCRALNLMEAWDRASVDPLELGCW